MSDINQNTRTAHGEHIAMQIQGEDAYGTTGVLTAADVWHLLDTLESHYMEQNVAELEVTVTSWKRQLEASYPDMETV